MPGALSTGGALSRGSGALSRRIRASEEQIRALLSRGLPTEIPLIGGPVGTEGFVPLSTPGPFIEGSQQLEEPQQQPMLPSHAAPMNWNAPMGRDTWRLYFNESREFLDNQDVMRLLSMIINSKRGAA